MVNITQEAHEISAMNKVKSQPLLSNKNITINDEEFTIRKYYVKHNKIFLVMYNKKTRKRSLFSVVKIIDENSVKKDSKIKRIYYSIKNIVLKYIKR